MFGAPSALVIGDGTRSDLQEPLSISDLLTTAGQQKEPMASQSKLMACLCKRGLAPKEWAQDEAKLAAMGRYPAEVRAQSRPESIT